MSRRRIPAPDNPEAGLIPPEYVHRKGTDTKPDSPASPNKKK